MSDHLLDSLDIEPSEDRQDEIRRQKQEVYEANIEAKHEQLVQRRTDLAAHQAIDLSVVDNKRLQESVIEGGEYLKLAAEAKVFINDDFKGYIPYFSRNVILIAAPTGNGKSTTCANLAYHALLSGQKILIVTNEEVTSDVYNRVICLIKGWAYVDHGNFSQHQLDTFAEMTLKIGQHITIVDDNYSGSPGQTTTVEGFESVFESLIEKKAKFDVVIFDYYQNVTSSNKHPDWSDWKCQERVAKYLDSFKKRYNAPIIVLAQLRDADEKSSFKERIQGRKIILDTATCAIEMIAERENQRTAFTIKKSRFSEGVGETVYTGFDRGKYVLYTPAFANAAELKKAARSHETMLSGLFGKAGVKGE